MPTTLFLERDKNILKANLLLFLMVSIATLIPPIIYIISKSIILTLIFAFFGFFYIISILYPFTTALNSLHAKRISKGMLKDPKIKQLKDIVEELKIASAYKGKIELYIINDPNINAMAISYGKKAAIAITEGALEKLNREELSGVIGHEISHIINRDSDVKLIAYVALGALYAYAYIALKILKSSSRKQKGALMLIIALITVVSYIIGILVFFAISRKREILADVESVRLNRNKYALINALKKIKQNGKMKVPTTASSLFFANPINPKTSGVFFNLLKTHPPIDERIKYLENL